VEVEASKYGLNYIKLAAAWPAWSTAQDWPWPPWTSLNMRAAPANFLDVGGGASSEQVKNAFRILMSDPSVRAVFINIFEANCASTSGTGWWPPERFAVEGPGWCGWKGTNVKWTENPGDPA